MLSLLAAAVSLQSSPLPSPNLRGGDPTYFPIAVWLQSPENADKYQDIGINLYVVQGLRKRGRIDDVIIGASPFVIGMLLMILILSIWPQIALWLPQVSAG